MINFIVENKEIQVELLASVLITGLLSINLLMNSS